MSISLSFGRFLRTNWLALASAMLLLITIFTLATSTSSAQGCGISSFTMVPGHPLSLGQDVRLEGTSNCGTVKFTVYNTATKELRTLEELGSSNLGSWWRTSQTGSGNFDVCFWARGDGGWENAAKNCKAVYVQGGSGPNPSLQGCRITNFSAAPNPIPEGSTLSISGSGACGNGVRATRILVHGHVISEIGNSTLAATWQTSGRGAASICIQVTQGAWDLMSDTAEQCLNIHISDPGGNPGTGVAIPPTATPQPNSGGGNNGGGSGSSNSCNSHQSYLSTGAIARVDVSLDVYDAPDGRVIDDLSRGKLVTVIGGSACVRGSLRWEIGYDGKSGWATESTTYGSYYMVNNGGGDSSSGGGNNSGGNNSGGGGSTSPQATPRPSSSACNSLSYLQVGDVAYVSDETPDPLPLRTGASTSHDIIMQVAVREEVTIMGGPNCQENVVWWQVSYNGQPGWMAEINKFNNRNLLFVRETSVEPEGSNSVRTVSYNHAPWDGYYFEFEVDPESCHIINGADIIAREMSHYSYRLSEMPTAAHVLFAVQYFTPDTGPFQFRGEIEVFRQSVIEHLENNFSGCIGDDFKYQVGGQTMDTSGLGNILFGHFAAMAEISYESEDWLSNSEQGANFRSFLQFYDNGDDLIQRLVGRRLAETYGLAPSANEIVSIAEQFNLR